MQGKNHSGLCGSHGPAQRRPRLLIASTVASTLRLFARGQIAFMREHGFDVAAVASPGPVMDEVAATESLEVYAVPMAREIAPFADLLALFRLVRVIRRAKPDIVNAGTPKAGLLVGIAAWVARVPVRIYTMRGFRFPTLRGPKRRLMVWAERLSCACAQRVFAVGNGIRRISIEQHICPAEKSVVLAQGSSNGVDADRFSRQVHESAGRRLRGDLGIRDHDVVFGFLGRFVRDKGIAELAEAWKRLRERNDHIHLLMLGVWEQGDPAPSNAREYFENNPSVHILPLSWDTPPRYAAMDAVVLPTYREGFPNVPLEAAAMELPTVASDVPGCDDAVVDGQTGLLVPVRDPQALANAMQRLIDDADLRRQLGQAGRQRVLREYQSCFIWSAMLQEYRRLLQERGLPLPTEPLWAESPTVGLEPVVRGAPPSAAASVPWT